MENKTELGSEFNLSLNNLRTVKNNLFQYMSKYRVQWYDYGRSAIRHIPVPKNKIILLPEFICESVIDCFDRSMVNFYKVVDNFDIDIEDLTGKVNSDVGIIYVAYYFGYIQNEDTMQKIKKIAHKYGVTIVEDTTQSLFSEHEIIGDYAVASIRKWMPIPMGGMLYTNLGGTFQVRKAAISVQTTPKPMG